MDILTHITGKIWKVERTVGSRVAVGEAIAIVESMKMEVPIESPVAGTLVELRCAVGDAVEEDQVIAVVE